MQQPQQLPPEEYLEIADKVRSGEYFREARNMYDMMVHDPMAERYLYIFITSIAIGIFFIAFFAAQALYPLKTSIPFIVNTNDIVDDRPRIRTLLDQQGEDPSEALLRYLIKNYVVFREQYDIASFDRNLSGIRSQSTKEVVAEFEQAINPRNPDSPITLYQRHSRRNINVVIYRHPVLTEPRVEVIFDATIESKNDVKKSRWQSDITFEYSGVELDEKINKVKPVKFVVTQYRSKRLQDIK